VAAAAGAAYSIMEVEDTKDESREEASEAVNSLRADLEVLREQLTERVDTLEGRVDNAADAETQRKLQQDLDALDKRVKELDQQDSGTPDNLTTRVDDLEQRVEDLEQDSN
jgi:hypothetical protein